MNPLGPPASLCPIASGNAKETAWFNQIRKNVEQRTVRVGPGLKISYKTDHTLVELAGQASGVVAGGFDWQGEWKDKDYSAGAVVIRGSRNVSSSGWNDDQTILFDGAISGTYIALSDVPQGTPAPEEPNSGDFWETVSRYATHIFAVRDKTIATSGKIVLVTVDKRGTLSVTGVNGISATTIAGETDVSETLLGATLNGAARSVTIDTTAAHHVGIDNGITGDKGRPLSIQAIKSCDSSDPAGQTFIRLVLCSDRIRIT